MYYWPDRYSLEYSTKPQPNSIRFHQAHIQEATFPMIFPAKLDLSRGRDQTPPHRAIRSWRFRTIENPHVDKTAESKFIPNVDSKPPILSKKSLDIGDLPSPLSLNSSPTLEDSCIRQLCSIQRPKQPSSPIPGTRQPEAVAGRKKSSPAREA